MPLWIHGCQRKNRVKAFLITSSSSFKLQIISINRKEHYQRAFKGHWIHRSNSSYKKLFRLFLDGTWTRAEKINSWMSTHCFEASVAVQQMQISTAKRETDKPVLGKTLVNTHQQGSLENANLIVSRQPFWIHGLQRAGARSGSESFIWSSNIRSSRSHQTLPVLTRLLQTDIHSYPWSVY